jgi:hypothetical protein
VKKPALALLLALTGPLFANASITEIRRDFFEQTANLPATAIMSAPAADGSYLISIYESHSTDGTTPTVRWIDENGVAQSWIAYPLGGTNLLRVQAGTVPTIGTANYISGTYSLYVSGFGFWPVGQQEQGGIAKLTGEVARTTAIYNAASGVSALLVASSAGTSDEIVPYFSWWDDYGKHYASVPVGTSGVFPLRIAGSTSVEVNNNSGLTNEVWYALVLFGLPASGNGPLIDYEYDLLDWRNATYPAIETITPGGGSIPIVLVAANIAEQPNTGAVSEQLDIAGTTCDGKADPSGAPAACVRALFSPTMIQLWTINTPGSPWGPSPTYSAEVDIIQF